MAMLANNGIGGRDSRQQDKQGLLYLFLFHGWVAAKQWWAKLLRLLTVNSLSYFVKIKY
jgi:hypothetical protein